jgi:hypothetical protein
MAVTYAGAPGGRDGGRPVTGSVGVTHGRQPAVRLLVLRRSCQPSRGERPPGACARPTERAVGYFASWGALPRAG